MTYHVWGDEWFEMNEAALYEAANYIYTMTYRLSFCRLMWKEKYGTIRYEYLFTPLDRSFGYRYGNSYLNRQWHRYGRYMLNKVIARAAKKYPSVAPEILDDAQWIT